MTSTQTRGAPHYSGIYSGRWDTFSGNECSSVSQIRYHRSAGVPANYAVFGTLINGSGQRQNFTNLLWGATVYVSDRDNPTVEQGARRIPPGWTKDTTFDVTATDSGIGVDWTQVRLAAPNKPDYLDSRQHPCSADPANHCPRTDTFSYTTSNMPEGESTVSAQAGDLIRVPAFSEIGTIKIDRSGPTIAPEPTGALYKNRNRTDDHRREGLYDAQATIHAEAKDDPNGPANSTARSGTQTLALWVDKNRDNSWSGDEKVKTATNATCTTTQCPNGLPLDYSLATDPLADGDYKVKLEATDLAGNTGPAKEWTVTVDRVGDFYEARQVTAPSGPDIEVSHEWLKFGTLQGRSETADSLNTRRTEPCQDTPAESCDVARKRTFFSDEGLSNPDSPDAYETTTGPPGSSEVPNVLRLLIKQEIKEAPAAEGDLFSATEPWQTLPPAHGGLYSRFDIAGSRSAGASPEEKSAEEVFPPDSDEATTLQVFLDKQTGLPVTLRWVSSTGAPLDQTYWTYGKARKRASDYPPDFLVAPKPSNQSGMRTETRVKGNGAMGSVTDDETHSDFRPWYLGSAIELAGAGPMCLRQNITVTHSRMQTAGEADIPDAGSDPDVEPALRSAAIETLAQASYVLAPELAKCADGNFVGTGDAWSLDIVTMKRDSSNARTWRAAFEQDAQASEVVVDDPDALRQGLQPFTFGQEIGIAFVVPSGEGSSALVDVGSTTIIITGPFTKSSLQSVLDQFRSQ